MNAAENTTPEWDENEQDTESDNTQPDPTENEQDTGDFDRDLAAIGIEELELGGDVQDQEALLAATAETSNSDLAWLVAHPGLVGQRPTTVMEQRAYGLPSDTFVRIHWTEDGCVFRRYLGREQ